MIAAVTVIGGGRMGAGIAQAALVTGAEVTVVETSPDTAAAARDRVERGIGIAVGKGLAVDPGTLRSRLSVTDSVAAIPAGTGLVVEAVIEDAATKVAVLTAAETAAPAAILASNTSALSITELGAALRNPGRFLGLHFFNPVPVSELVEIITAPATDADVLTTCRDWVGELGKTAIVIRDSPGFASSRLGVALGLEAIRMLEDGVADAAAIDTAMTLGYQHPVGPLRLTDLVGLDVRLAIADHLTDALGARFAAPALLRHKVAAGELGRKTGRGFYDWV